MIALILGIGFLLRIINIGKVPCGDEAMVINIATQDPANLMAMLKTTDVYPPFTYILLHYWMKISQSPVWIRSYFIIFGLGSCLLVYLIAKEYLGKKEAIIALILAVFSPLLIFGSQYIRSYMDSAFFILCSTLFMLKIINGKDTTINRISYAVSAALAFYTFYFSALIVFAQFLFVMIFGPRRKAWLLTFLASGIAFLPWFLSAANQLHNSSSIPYDWSTVGLNIGSFRLGLYARSIAALFGIDPYFLVFREGIMSKFPYIVSIGVILAALSIFILFIYNLVVLLKRRFGNRPDMLWFIPALSILPVILSWISAAVFNVIPVTKYFLALHGIFIVAMALFIYGLFEKNLRLALAVLGLILAVFILRLPQAVSEEFDPKGVAIFLTNNAKNDIVISKGSCPAEGVVNVLTMNGLFALDKKGRTYLMAPEEQWGSLAKTVRGFKKVWFYRVYGNDEIFGANRLVKSWLETQGYKEKRINRFKNTDVVEYEK